MSIAAENAHPSAIRVAVVDDHRLVIDGIEARLSAARGIEVVIGATDWPGLVSHQNFPVDVVVLDLNLDDHIPIATKIRALNATGSRTVVISRHADASTIHGAIKAGALAFIPKTDPADELVQAIRAVASGAVYETRTVRDALEQAANAQDPGLGKQEYRALVLYAAGRSIREVATEMDTTDETVKSYIKRGRRKYRQIGIDLGTKILLRGHAIREGWLNAE
ncbi:response regulator transcription factor [soil metagenome]